MLGAFQWDSPRLHLPSHFFEVTNSMDNSFVSNALNEVEKLLSSSLMFIPASRLAQASYISSKGWKGTIRT
jgi:hypothetical protein